MTWQDSKLDMLKSRISGLRDRQFTYISADHPDREEVLAFCDGLPRISVKETSEGIEISYT